MNLLFYSTSGCHLCEKAKEILWPLLDEYPLRLREIEISDTDELLERYGVRIPVFGFESGEELGWPFDAKQLRNFLASGSLKIKK